MENLEFFVSYHFVAWWHSGKGIGLATPKVTGLDSRHHVFKLSLGQVVHTRASVTKQYNVVLVEGR